MVDNCGNNWTDLGRIQRRLMADTVRMQGRAYAQIAAYQSILKERNCFSYPSAGLPGPSRRIRVEPVEIPANVPPIEETSPEPVESPTEKELEPIENKNDNRP